MNAANSNSEFVITLQNWQERLHNLQHTREHTREELLEWAVKTLAEVLNSSSDWEIYSLSDSSGLVSRVELSPDRVCIYHYTLEELYNI